VKNLHNDRNDAYVTLAQCRSKFSNVMDKLSTRQREERWSEKNLVPDH